MILTLIIASCLTEMSRRQRGTNCTKIPPNIVRFDTRAKKVVACSSLSILYQLETLDNSVVSFHEIYTCLSIVARLFSFFGGAKESDHIWAIKIVQIFFR